MVIYNNVQKALLDSLAMRTIYVVNGLDQQATVTIYGTLSPENMGVELDSFLVDPGAEDFRTLLASVTGAVPYVYATVQCATAPTEGEILLQWVKHSFQVEMLKEEIRDTNVHTSKVMPWWVNPLSVNL